MTRERIAVVGAAVSGLAAAYLLQRRHDVLLFEAEPRLGGGAHTRDVDTGTDTLAVDTGFIVHHERTYPNLLRLFGESGVRTQDSDMSMSVRRLGCGLEYDGARGPRGLFPTAGVLGRPRYLRMLTEVTRFHRHARRVLAEGDDGATLGSFLAAGRYSDHFRDFLLPMVPAVWSAPERLSRDYLFEFLANHGLLSVSGSPRWRTVTAGLASTSSARSRTSPPWRSAPRPGGALPHDRMLAGAVPGRRRGVAGVRRDVPAAVGVLPGLLGGGVRVRVPGRVPAAPGARAVGCRCGR